MKPHKNPLCYHQKTAQKVSVSLRRRLKVKFSHSMLAVVMITCIIWITANSVSPLGFRGDKSVNNLWLFHFSPLGFRSEKSVNNLWLFHFVP